VFWPGDLLKVVLAAVIAVGVHKAFPRIAGTR
jgi:biotin transport system substrate-specific component